MLRRLWILGFVAAVGAAQKYSGPLPAKPDVVYLKQAANLIPLEAVAAREQKRDKGTLYSIEGAESHVKTPISLPIFLVKAEKLAADRLELYKMDVRDGHREFVVGGPNPPEILHLEVSKVGTDGTCRIAVSDPLDAGEYVLRAEGSPQVFCFQVF